MRKARAENRNSVGKQGVGVRYLLPCAHSPLKVAGGARGRRQYSRLRQNRRTSIGVDEAISKHQKRPPATQPENAGHASYLMRGAAPKWPASHKSISTQPPRGLISLGAARREIVLRTPAPSPQFGAIAAVDRRAMRAGRCGFGFHGDAQFADVGKQFFGGLRQLAYC